MVRSNIRTKFLFILYGLTHRQEGTTFPKLSGFRKYPDLPYITKAFAMIKSMWLWNMSGDLSPKTHSAVCIATRAKESEPGKF